MHKQTTINARGILIDLDSPVIMGILNVTPDSFFDGGEYNAAADAIEQAGRMIAEGASIIDIGGMSSRPGARILSSEEEQERIMPVIEGVLEAYPETPISIDTIHAETARAAIDAGVHMINDISGGRYDDAMLETVGTYGDIPFVCMHMQGLPENMQVDPSYGDVVYEILQFFVQRLEACRTAGITDVVVDPGFGFGKTLEHNYEILRKLGVLRILEVPVLAGISRKSVVCKVLKVNPENALNGTSVLNTIAVLNGAKILRVHDVAEAAQVIELCRFYASVGENPEEVG